MNNYLRSKVYPSIKAGFNFSNQNDKNDQNDQIIRPDFENLQLYFSYVYENKKLSFVDYNQAITNNEYFKAARVLKELLKDNTNYDNIKLIIDDNFMIVYSLLFERCFYNILNSINELIIFEYIDFLDENYNTIKELHKEINVNNDLLYLTKYIEPTSMTFDLNVSPDVLFTYILDKINTEKSVDEDILCKVCILFLSLVNDKIELKQQKLIPTEFTEPYKLLLSKYFTSSNLDISTIINTNPIFNESILTNGTPTFRRKFNMYLFYFFNNGLVYKNLIEWFFVLNLKNTKDFYILFSLLFNVPLDKVSIVISQCIDQGLTINKENITTVLENLDPSISIEPLIELEPLYFDESLFKALVQTNLTIKSILSVNNLNNELFNINSFYSLVQYSPFEKVVYIDTKDYLDKDLNSLIKMYNTLELINHKKEVILIYDGGYKYLNVKNINSNTIEHFNKEMLYYYFKKLFNEYALDIDYYRNLKDNSFAQYLNDPWYPVNVLRVCNVKLQSYLKSKFLH